MYKLFLSLRYFRSRFMALAALLAITFGVAMLLIVHSIMGGYVVQLKENIRGQEAHLQITSRSDPFGVARYDDLAEAVLALDNVRGIAPFIERSAMFKRGLAFKLCLLKGIDPASQASVTALGRQILRPAELDAILAEYVPERIGNEPARDVDVQLASREIRSLLTAPERKLLAPEEISTIFGEGEAGFAFREKMLQRDPEQFNALDGDIPHAVVVGIQLFLEREMQIGQVLQVATLRPDGAEPITERFIVTGAINTGEFSAEAMGNVYVGLRKLQSLLDLFDGEGFRYQGARVAVERTDPASLEATRAAIERVLLGKGQHLAVRTWEELRRNMLKAVEIEKQLILWLMKILVAFTGSMVCLMLILTVIEKTRDVGILMALGASPFGIMSIFLVNGLVLCLLGTALGIVGGVVFCEYINPIHDWIYNLTGVSLFPAKIYQMDRIPITYGLRDVLDSAWPAIVCGLIASLIPALWAPLRNPIRSMQHE